MQVQDQVPREILLHIPYPHDCECGDRNSYQYCHASCKTNAYINSAQFCQYFIQHAQFKCSDKTAQAQQDLSKSDFMMALAQVLRSVQQQVSDKDLYDFVSILNLKIPEKWTY